MISISGELLSLLLDLTVLNEHSAILTWRFLRLAEKWLQEETSEDNSEAIPDSVSSCLPNSMLSKVQLVNLLARRAECGVPERFVPLERQQWFLRYQMCLIEYRLLMHWSYIVLALTHRYYLKGLWKSQIGPHAVKLDALLICNFTNNSAAMLTNLRAVGNPKYKFMSWILNLQDLIIRCNIRQIERALGDCFVL